MQKPQLQQLIIENNHQNTENNAKLLLTIENATAAGSSQSNQIHKFKMMQKHLHKQELYNLSFLVQKPQLQQLIIENNHQNITKKYKCKICSDDRKRIPLSN